MTTSWGIHLTYVLAKQLSPGLITFLWNQLSSLILIYDELTYGSSQNPTINNK